MVSSERLSMSYVMKLVSWATEEMLMPHAGTTTELIPLHYATDYEVGFFNPKEQPLLVKQLLDRCEKAIHFKISATAFKIREDRVIDVRDASSIYKWHRLTEETFTTTMRNMIDYLRKQTKMPERSQKLDSDKLNAQDSTNNSISGTQSNPSVRQSKYSEKKDGISNINSQPSNEPNEQKPQSGTEAETVLQKRLEEAENASQKVIRELQLHYLRTSIETPLANKLLGVGENKPSDDDKSLDENATNSFFGSEMKDVQLGLYLKEHPNGQPVKEDSIRKFFNRRKLNPILAFVSLPQAPVTLVGDMTNHDRPKYRDERLFYFDWLQRDMKVEKIIKVIVADMDNSHSDESIEEAIGGRGKGPESLRHDFDVEILNWRKIDLCPKTISNAAPNVRELHLEWSGNNSVLRGWSAIDGLATLRMLRQIHLSYPKGKESSTRIAENVKEFKRTLAESREKCKEIFLADMDEKQATDNMAIKSIEAFGPIKLFLHQKLLGGVEEPLSALGEQPADIIRHRWLAYMEDFVSCIVPLPKDMKEVLNDRQVVNNVTVALIDDGVDVFTEGMDVYSDQIEDGVSFDRSDDRHPASGWYSRAGHGTLMAKLILAVCPWARIIPYRILMRPDKQGRMVRPDPTSAAKAISHAMGRGVDIISMSWSIYGNINDSNTANFEGLRELNNAVPEAQKTYNLKDLPLMFCAASDDGSTTSDNKEYPADCHWEKFRIGAATDTLQTWTNVSNPKGVHFFFPGVDVPNLRAKFQFTSPSAEKDLHLKSGSSIATAFAAGQAALILHCTKLAIYHTHKGSNVANPIHEHDLRQIKTFDKMKSAFDSISSQNLTGQRAAYPARRFQEATEEMRAMETRGELEMPGRLVPVAQLVRNIMGWKS